MLWTCYYLYVMLDVYNRYVVEWLLTGRESVMLAEELTVAAYARQHIEAGQLTIHTTKYRSDYPDRFGSLVDAPVGSTFLHLVQPGASPH